ncbi:glutamyl aminopeptidase isoform X2 [Hirundo rustica]|uniref:glutamyl aminopeptidase isoform X2 n=1 Tax=Hirundo rustica TaxID=43150 RepID=UPI001A946AC4|nr:glutamyl aminopeptidase isoform X2 [Hirundo rustica]
MEGMDFEDEKSKRYCMKTKHVAIICGVVVVVGLAVGLGVGLSRPKPPKATEQPTTDQTTTTEQPPPPVDLGPCPSKDDENGDWRDFRLPTYVKPVHYDLEIKPEMEKDTYSGTVNIFIALEKPTNALWLHLRETKVTEIPTLRKSSGQQIALNDCFEYNPQEYIVMKAATELPVTDESDPYVLTLKFQGWLNGSLVGFYRTTYTESGQIKSIAATDHEPTDARKSFPCFDEPNKKATYNISIIHQDAYQALSNMPVQQTVQLGNGWSRTTFEKSVPMSTYLVCFAVHQFAWVERKSASGKPLEQVLIEDVLPVLKDDSLLSSHPIVSNVSSPAEITSVFDGISYSKGASILRMIQDWITPELFQKGCQAYLKKHQFQNAKTQQFWEALEEASNKPVKKVMDTWTRQMGYPVLEMGDNSVFTQKRFLLDPNANASYPPSDLGYKWNIPVKWKLGDSSGYIFYNASDSRGITIEASPGTFLKVNPEHIGFFRVNYDAQNWVELSRLLLQNHTNFSTADRTGILDDAFSLARSGLVNYSVTLELTKYLRSETEYLPWNRAISAVTYLANMLEDDNDIYPLFQKYFRDLVKPIVDRLHWEDSGDHLQRLLRASVLDFACSMGDPESLSNASQLFDRWLQGETIAANLRLIVYRYGMQNSGNETSWNYMFKKYQETSLAQEKEKLLYGLASVRNITLLDRYLKYVQNTSLIKSQDVFTVLRYISYNTYGKTMAWDWIRLNWQSLVDRFTINDRTFGRIVTIAQNFNTELQLWQIENFFEKYPNAGAGEMPRSQTLEQVKSNIEWLKENKEEIQTWLNAH